VRRPLRGQWGDPLLRLEEVEQTLRHLTAARDAARAAGAVQTLTRINAAISSAKGAVRNAKGRVIEWREQHIKGGHPWIGP
jgi:hypothetical protein